MAPDCSETRSVRKIPFPVKTAVLVDGDFFLKRYRVLYKRQPGYGPQDPKTVAEALYLLARNHSRHKFLYRILYYDCKPYEYGAHNPISMKFMDFKKSDLYAFRNAFYKELTKKRKVAVRLGSLAKGDGWLINPDVTKSLLKGETKLEDIKPEDVYYDLNQKGVDIKMGLDIAALAYKRLVDQIVLIAGDSDFVPAAKLARREGIDVILDPMWNPIQEDLFTHIDGLKSWSPKPEGLT
jgi:uncharacterized LabA/DUF88 family protein